MNLRNNSGFWQDAAEVRPMAEFTIARAAGLAQSRVGFPNICTLGARVCQKRYPSPNGWSDHFSVRPPISFGTRRSDADRRMGRCLRFRAAHKSGKLTGITNLSGGRVECPKSNMSQRCFASHPLPVVLTMMPNVGWPVPPVARLSPMRLGAMRLPVPSLAAQAASFVTTSACVTDQNRAVTRPIQTCDDTTGAFGPGGFFIAATGIDAGKALGKGPKCSKRS
jgi:hypothetical protein